MKSIKLLLTLLTHGTGKVHGREEVFSSSYSCVLNRFHLSRNRIDLSFWNEFAETAQGRFHFQVFFTSGPFPRPRYLECLLTAGLIVTVSWEHWSGDVAVNSSAIDCRCNGYSVKQHARRPLTWTWLACGSSPMSEVLDSDNTGSANFWGDMAGRMAPFGVDLFL